MLPKKTSKTKIYKKEVSEALVKRALGYELEEVVEEYVLDKENENNLILNKKKITKKTLPPDISAAKTLLTIYSSKKVSDLVMLSDEALQGEKIKLLKELQDLEKKEK